MVERVDAAKQHRAVLVGRVGQGFARFDDAILVGGFDEVNGRLEEADQNLLAQAVLNEDGEISREEVMAAIESMERSEQQYLRGQLKTRISESERGGRFDEAMRLTAELQALERTARGRRL